MALAAFSLAAVPTFTQADENDWDKGRRMAERILDATDRDRDRDDVPSHFWRSQSSGENFSRTEAAVQRALAQRGYYRGPIDGDMGPGSRVAVARYQADHGMRATGAINDSLLRSLGL